MPSGVYIRKKKSVEDRFWKKVNKGPKCWEWVGARLGHGYGYFWFNSKNVLAHRFSWKLSYGNIGWKFVLHKCDNPPCVRPVHLKLGTHLDNMADVRAGNRRNWKA